MKPPTRNRRYRPDHKPIPCYRCGNIGGTLVKVDDQYEHQDKDMCSLLKFKKKMEV